MLMGMLDWLILGFPKLLTGLLPIVFVVVPSICHLKCCSSTYFYLFRKGHSYEVDLYCLGALLYELVTGLPPFYSSNQA